MEKHSHIITQRAGIPQSVEINEPEYRLSVVLTLERKPILIRQASSIILKQLYTYI